MRALPALLLSFALPAFTQAADLELKSLGTAKEDAIGKRKFGPYVGVAMGATTGQKGRVQLGNLKSDLNGHDGAAMISMEVGKSWRMRRIPLMFSLDAEGTFTATSLEGRFRNASRASDPRTYSADMSSLFFTLNGTFALDLWRYRARMGQVLAGFRPYVGGGFGGGQVWYRNATASTGTATAPSDTPFNIDEFINSWNWYAGLEWCWKDQYSLFAEYRKTMVGDLDDLANFSNEGYMIGFRYRY
jgi:opacity protein-like surface antigen